MSPIDFAVRGLLRPQGAAKLSREEVHLDVSLIDVATRSVVPVLGEGVI